jgi:hypothetical protein
MKGLSSFPSLLRKGYLPSWLPVVFRDHSRLYWDGDRFHQRLPAGFALAYGVAAYKDQGEYPCTKSRSKRRNETLIRPLRARHGGQMTVTWLTGDRQSNCLAETEERMR